MSKFLYTLLFLLVTSHLIAQVSEKQSKVIEDFDYGAAFEHTLDQNNNVSSSSKAVVSYRTGDEDEITRIVYRNRYYDLHQYSLYRNNRAIELSYKNGNVYIVYLKKRLLQFLVLLLG